MWLNVVVVVEAKLHNTEYVHPDQEIQLTAWPGPSILYFVARLQLNS